jgi:phosphocarrier protein
MSANKVVDDVLSLSREVEVLNKLGVHARPASLFVRVASRYRCNIFVEKDGDKINGKSIMGLLMLAAGPGSKLILHAQGDDATQAIAELEGLVNRKFDEED